MFSITNSDTILNSSSVNFSSYYTAYSGISEVERSTPCQSMKPIDYYSSTAFNNNHSTIQYKNFNGSCQRHAFCIKKPHEKFTTNLKRKRKRTMFTTEQIIALEEVFNKRPYINREERMAMMEKLQTSEKSIKVWFQNRRRLTDKRCKEQKSDSLSSDDMSNTFFERLEIIQSSINQNTDKYGLVRLDNDTMTELVNIIDEYLSQDPDTERIQPIENKTVVMYEPISPVSLTENLEEDESTHFESLSSEQITELESLLMF